uniref:Uncharacterized protein n=1 Tax=Oryza glumipatula TaxID=40148 RepID=A0A0E0A5I2_9ORYZ
MEIAAHAIPLEVAGKPSSLRRSPLMPSLWSAAPRGHVIHFVDNALTLVKPPVTPSCHHRRTTAKLRACLVIETPLTGDAFTLVAVPEALPMFT